MDKAYNPAETEDKWYSYWMEHKLFASKPNPDKEPFSVVIPPPNVTGVLHMGHMLNNTIQDVLVRKARMEGKEACWVPGTDHASIATETKVTKMLKELGIDKREIGREAFLEHAWEWKEKYGGIILEQLKKLGASCDWDRTRFTMEDGMSRSVNKVFVQLHEKGMIYRGQRMVNWDPVGQTALSDEEVVRKDVNSKLYHVQYKLEGSDETVTIATTRPETILGDSAICVHPEDERYQHLVGQKAIVPMVERRIPIIADSYVDREFGTGCLKVTPAHDINDWELGQKHGLEVIDVLNADGTMSEAAQFYLGEGREIVRKKIAKDLKASGHLIDTEDITNNVGLSERTQAVIEPRLTTQWFVKMDELVKPAIAAVENDEIRFHPPKFKNVYRHWMGNIRDWCISRQLWWGQRIPAYYLPNGEYVVAETAELALAKAQEKDANLTIEDLQQDADVVDTWFSSWLWPFSVFDGLENPGNEDIKFYYPTSALVTGHDIIFFWVARMIVAGYEFMDEMPFKDVYFTGMVRDEKRRKMSKQLGNSPDALKLIEKYGADGVRTGMLFSSPAGNDLLFDTKLCEQGRNFSNKLWNVLRLIKGWETAGLPMPQENKVAIEWLEARIDQSLAEVQAQFKEFRVSDALMTMYKLIWDDYCSWFLEIVKPEYQKPIDPKSLEAAIGFFEKLMQALHPFMPFITEELWQTIRERKDGESICVAAYPQTREVNSQILEDTAFAFKVIAEVRNIRNTKQIAPKQPVDLLVKAANKAYYDRFGSLISKMAFLEKLDFTDEKPDGAASFVHKADEFFVPLTGQIDEAAEKERLDKELSRAKGLLISVQKKLSNERFVNNAPEAVITKEKQKQADAEAKIKAIEEQLAGMG